MVRWKSPMENLVMNKNFWQGKKVFLTGHTGFKGGWLTIWLNQMGAEIHGYSLEPNTQSNLFTTANISALLKSNTIADIRNKDALEKSIINSEAEIIFHLAAQPLVRHSYSEPFETYEVNVMGTVNLFEAARKSKNIKAIINITTDKCYENKEWVWSYRENEPLGGYDPYSSSKACSELVTSAYRDSFFREKCIQVASVRAGNVIGGGDWADDRLIPDFLKALDKKEKLTIRSPDATRPWQHVLEPLSGYLLLAEKLLTESDHFDGAWNFGPNESDTKSVRWIVDYLCLSSKGSKWEFNESPQPHEANALTLDSSKAKIKLNWSPVWNLQEALKNTLDWHTAWKNNEDMLEKSISQIRQYSK